MTRYFFHIDGHTFRDEVGGELPDDQAARRTAMQLASDLESNRQLGETLNALASGQAALRFTWSKSKRTAPMKEARGA